MQVVLLTTREAIISRALLHCCEKRCSFIKLSIQTTFVLTSDVSENFRQIVDILTTLWFTLIGQTKSHDENSQGDVTNHRPSVPKNVCSELLLVLLSVLQSGMR
jgi:CRISPR/Cas system-associated endonuclease Cas1